MEEKIQGIAVNEENAMLKKKTTKQNENENRKWIISQVWNGANNEQEKVSANKLWLANKVRWRQQRQHQSESDDEQRKSQSSGWNIVNVQIIREINCLDCWEWGEVNESVTGAIYVIILLC